MNAGTPSLTGFDAEADWKGRRIFVQAGEVGPVGGAAKATMLLCEALSELGARVTLFVTLKPAEDVVKALANLGVIVVSALAKGGWRYRLPQLAIATQIWIKSQVDKPSLIHVVGISREAFHLLGLPMLPPVYVWETTQAQAGNKFVDRDAAKLLRRARAVLVPSTTIERNVRDTYKYGGLIGRLPFWSAEPPKSEVLPASEPPRSKILFFGRMDPEKGVSDLITALDLVRQSVPGARLTLCGGGRVETATGLQSLPDGVEFAGQVSSDELDNLIRNSDVVALPSLHEGYPISLLEACSRLVPIVATAVGSIPEVFEGRPCALLVPPRDPRALAEALVKILTEPGSAYDERRLDSRAIFEQVSSQKTVLENLRRAYV